MAVSPRMGDGGGGAGGAQRVGEGNTFRAAGLPRGGPPAARRLMMEERRVGRFRRAFRDLKIRPLEGA
ncbi:hypothetical protein JMJ56_23025 [Belnapia sp. T18]|uniref:Uncharacterized protein n=1 Tax=Belnapia arida TaxID=2804533 RepID=A0ABS1UCB6_9PROT|nr:hypothetical protein [Belnapia arida]MBL6080891.1 hypothetical protein [Belnapia arida]